jgi:hypothetical protein
MTKMKKGSKSGDFFFKRGKGEIKFILKIKV